MFANEGHEAPQGHQGPYREDWILSKGPREQPQKGLEQGSAVYGWCGKSMRLKEIQTAEKREAVERTCRNYGAGEAPRKEDREEKGRGSE